MGAFNVCEFRAITARRASPRAVANAFAAAVPDYPPADPGKVVAGCPALRHAVQRQAEVSEPYWRLVIGVAKRCQNSEATAHAWSREHPGYTRAETQAKLDGWTATGAPLCSTIEAENPKACATCAHRGTINSPVVLGYPNAPGAGGEPVTVEPVLSIEAGMLTISKRPPPKRHWTIDRLLPQGKYAILAGLGGVSKTMLALAWGVHVATGKPWNGLEVAEGAVLHLLGEEDRDEVRARLGAICAPLSDDERARVTERSLAFPWAGRDMRMTLLSSGNPQETALPTEIIKTAQRQAERAGVPVRLIVIDHARLAIGGDPNDAQHVTEVTRVMTKIAEATGAAVVLIAHSPKAAIGKLKAGEDADAADVAGSISWVDNARAALVLTSMRADEAKHLGVPSEARHSYARLRLVKANYAPSDWDCWLHRQPAPEWGAAVPVPVSLAPTPQVRADAGLESRIQELVTKMPLSMRQLRTTYAGRGKYLAASDGDVQLVLTKMLADGRLRQRAPTSDERDRFGLHRTPLILEVA